MGALFRKTARGERSSEEKLRTNLSKKSQRCKRERGGRVVTRTKWSVGIGYGKEKRKIINFEIRSGSAIKGWSFFNLAARKGPEIPWKEGKLKKWMLAH